MERCNPRTMEIFRRLGLAETIRAAGYPPDWPMDAYLVFSLMKPPLFRMAYPSVAEAKANRDATNDGTVPLEPYQIISQYTLEPLLKSVAEKIPNVAVKFGHHSVQLRASASFLTHEATGISLGVGSAAPALPRLVSAQTASPEFLKILGSLDLAPTWRHTKPTHHRAALIAQSAALRPAAETASRTPSPARAGEATEIRRSRYRDAWRAAPDRHRRYRLSARPG